MRISFCELSNLKFSIIRERYLGYGLSIKRVPRNIGQFIDEERGYTVPFPNNRWMIYGVPRYDSTNLEEAEIANKIRVLIDTFLIYCGEEVYPGAQYGYEHGRGKRIDKVRNSVSKMYGGILNERSMIHDEISISSRQVKQIQKLLAALVDVEDNDFIRIPLSFYREACISRYVNWKIIVYLCIALESLFLMGENNKASELSKRVASYFNQNNQYDGDVYLKAFALYKCRNSIVHDGNLSPTIEITNLNSNVHSSYSINELTTSGYEVLRNTFQKLLRDNILDKKSFIHSIRQLSAYYQWPNLAAKVVKA